MNSVLTEKEFQHHFLDKLEEQEYEVRDARHYDRFRALDTELLLRFLEDTQPDEMQALRKIYKDQFDETLLNCIQREETQKGRLYLLRHGLELNHVRLTFMFAKPATDFNKKLMQQYEHNIFSVAQEAHASDSERVDLVTFLNGFAVTAIELKATPAGQSYRHAIRQFREDRSPKTRLFAGKAGVLVCFAMDETQVAMTTRLSGMSTLFLPFNKGCGEGVRTGAGNPLTEDDYPVSYMWEDILSKDTLLEIISKFMFVEVSERVDPETGKKTRTEKTIFPRYHQLDAVRRIVSDVREFGTQKNYLIQHSAGSGKTNTLAWLAHRFASLHDVDNKQVFDTIVICTDRVVVDRQLQAAVLRLEEKSGLVKVMDEGCTSADLARALSSNTRIIATTIQKFPRIVDEVRNLKEKSFAVIIDEAHSSTAGKSMMAVTRTLSSGVDDDELTMEDLMNQEMESAGKQPNVSMFAFTATPKPLTLELFGTTMPDGSKAAFHVYSMKQAIEEGFILDVLQNYTTYKTFVTLNKMIEEDPKYDTEKARRQISRFITLDDTNIQQRVQIIIEHFRASVMEGLNGTAKAMVVTGSRAEAVKYHKAFEEYVERKGYDDIHALVAFSGKVRLDDDDVEYSEPVMNGFSERALPAQFSRDENNVLIVANKYQTGFDQPRLCAMYILKNLQGISAVQTLSRLNRVVPGKDKQTFVLDFRNDYDDIRDAFSKYYTVTFLSNSVTPADIHELLARLDGYDVLDEDDIERYNELRLNAPDEPARRKMKRLLDKARRRIDKLVEHEGENMGREVARTIRHFIRFYEFLLQATCYKDTTAHCYYHFLVGLSALLRADDIGAGFSLKDKISVTHVRQQKQKEHAAEALHADPALRLPKADRAYATEENCQRLSEIIREINERYGSSFAEETTLKAVLQVKDLMLQSDALRRSAQSNNYEDFARYAVGEQLDDALTGALEENYAFFKLLLEDTGYKERIMRIFTPELFRQMRADPHLSVGMRS